MENDRTSSDWFEESAASVRNIYVSLYLACKYGGDDRNVVRIHLDYSGQTIGLVSEGLGQVFEHGKDEPLQLSDIIPKEAVYDKMRPPKVEGKKNCITVRLAVLMQEKNLFTI